MSTAESWNMSPIKRITMWESDRLGNEKSSLSFSKYIELNFDPHKKSYYGDSDNIATDVLNPRNVFVKSPPGIVQ